MVKALNLKPQIAKPDRNINKDAFKTKIFKMNQANNQFKNCTFGITGASGALGKALTKKLRSQGAYVIGITHQSIKFSTNNSEIFPQEWINWSCGDEENLKEELKRIDILILNHGFNPHGSKTTKAIDDALEINALSTWRLIKCFENIVLGRDPKGRKSQLWINTSEAEIQAALSPGYELSKRLIGSLVSIKRNNLSKDQRDKLFIRKLILGPFKSDLNPIGIMSAEFVANSIIIQSKWNFYLIIVTPNPFTYLIMPIIELTRSIYYSITSDLKV